MAEATEVTETSVAALFRALEAEQASIVWARESRIARACEAHGQSVASWRRFKATDIARKAAAATLPTEREQLARLAAQISLEFARGCEAVRAGQDDDDPFLRYREAFADARWFWMHLV